MFIVEMVKSWEDMVQFQDLWREVWLGSEFCSSWRKKKEGKDEREQSDRWRCDSPWERWAFYIYAAAASAFRCASRGRRRGTGGRGTGGAVGVEYTPTSYLGQECVEGMDDGL